MNMDQLMKQAQRMQTQMQKLQEELQQRTFEATAGGGAVVVICTGDHRVQSIQIAPELIQESDRELLQDLILTAVNEAIQTAKETAQREMSKLTGGMNLPGM